MEELQKVIPNSEIRERKGLDLKRIIPQAKERDFTVLVVVHEDKKKPSILQSAVYCFTINNIYVAQKGLHREHERFTFISLLNIVGQIMCL